MLLLLGRWQRRKGEFCTLGNVATYAGGPVGDQQLVYVNKVLIGRSSGTKRFSFFSPSVFLLKEVRTS